MNEMTMTVIIPTYRPDGRFRELVRRLLLQSILPEQILIVNTGEEYFDPALLPEGREEQTAPDRIRVIHIRREAFDHGGTRAMAAGLADTDLLVFMTMDAIPKNRHLLEELRRPFEDPAVACVYGRQLPAKDAGVLETYTRHFNYDKKSRRKTKADLPDLGVKTFFCSNVCAAYRKDIYERLGGFETRAIFNEDMIYAGKAIMAGYAVYYNARARVIHSHHYSALMQLRRNFDLGVSQQQHPDLFAIVSSEGEGIRMIRQEAAYLLRTGQGLLLPKLIWQSGCKYLGYRLGKRYEALPVWMIRKLTMNRGYWSENGR